VRVRIDRRFFYTRTGIGLIAVTAAVLLWALVAFLQPLPSRHLSMATGPPGSSYAEAGERYREILARDGVTLRLVPTNGAVDNVSRLSDSRSGISVGFVQSGSVSASAGRDLESLGTVFYEVVWVFCRCPGPPRPLSERAGWRISIGPEGSADRPLALKLLALNGVDIRQFQLFSYSPAQAGQALLEERLDVALIVTGWSSPIVQSLARDANISLMSFPRADAYVALNPNLSKLILPRGVADLVKDRPPQDTILIASKASLAVRKDLHPALQYLLLQAALEVHSNPGMFHHAGEFPAAEAIDLPLSEPARQIYRAGPSFLQRSLPFWLAELVQRVLILVVPIVGIVYPLWTIVPRLYTWSMRRRVSRFYADLRIMERELRVAAPAQRHRLVQRLDQLDRRVLDLRVPAVFDESTFNLRAHVRALRLLAAGSDRT
jgi:TRAP-type uncharacterized transport system substrate-binding protein